MNKREGYTCCVFGHRKINETTELTKRLTKVIEALIKDEGVATFFFGSKSDFDSLCLKIVTTLKEKYHHIRRVYVRAEYADISRDYENCLMKSYEETYYPESIRGSGKASYVERNREMINNSDFCIVYYDENYLPAKRKKSKGNLSEYQPKSGTALAYDYAIKKEKEIVNVYSKINKKNNEQSVTPVRTINQHKKSSV